MPIVRRAVVALTVASGLAVTALVVPAGAGPRPVEFTGIGSSTTGPTTTATTTPPGASSSGPVGSGAAATRGALAVSGSVGGLYPGVTLPLVLTVANPAAAPVTVTSVKTSVANASKLCKKKNLTVATFTGSVAVPADGQGTVTVEVTMAHSAGDACQGAVFHLTYHGKAISR